LVAEELDCGLVVFHKLAWWCSRIGLAQLTTVDGWHSRVAGRQHASALFENAGDFYGEALDAREIGEVDNLSDGSHRFVEQQYDQPAIACQMRSQGLEAAFVEIFH